jgi:hypothetical protein
MERQMQIKCIRCNIFMFMEVSESEVKTWVGDGEQGPQYPEFAKWHECPDGGYGINTVLGFTPSGIYVAQPVESEQRFDITGNRISDTEEG